MNQYLMHIFSLGRREIVGLRQVSQGVVLWSFLPIRNLPTITSVSGSSCGPLRIYL